MENNNYATLEDFFGEPALSRAIVSGISEARSDISTLALNPESKGVSVGNVFHRVRMILEIPASSVTKEEREIVEQLIREQLWTSMMILRMDLNSSKE